MVQVYSITLGQYKPKDSVLLAQETDLSSFSYFQRGSVQEFMGFFVKTVIERTPPGNRAKVEQDRNYFCFFEKQHC
jgi:synaptobrevin family protein YKT6